MTYVGNSIDENIRYNATSGGVGSAIIKYLFEKKIISNALSFRFDKYSLSYKPIIIYSYKEYVPVGSIYHNIDLYHFYQEQFRTGTINGDGAVFCLPCQALPLRKLFERNGKNVFILGLTCSSQLNYEATTKLLALCKIEPCQVTKIQYRGNGWPSGVQIFLNNGQTIRINKSLWRDIFHSRLFILDRCFNCNNTLNKFADIVLADPWLKKYMETEHIGKTLFKALTLDGCSIVINMIKEHYIEAQKIDDDYLTRSQYKTILRKESYFRHPKVRNFIKFLYLNKLYHFFVSNVILFRLHLRFNRFIENFIIEK